MEEKIRKQRKEKKMKNKYEREVRQTEEKQQEHLKKQQERPLVTYQGTEGRDVDTPPPKKGRAGRGKNNYKE